ncbi:MAG: NAD(P)H-dependent oxidoreductase [Propionibacteriaceae bacterium]|jgi:chromate reductase|nr:NAD(P)H-dependent oxidoreductase [Propionibacteriaceae bacterium]
MTYKVGVIIGSLRAGSINRMLFEALKPLAAEAGMEFSEIAIRDLPLYNDDVLPNPPAAVVEYKKQLKAADAVLYITPEYNRGVPAPIKNAIDWGSRPMGQAENNGQISTVIGASMGALATSIAQNHLRSSLLFLDNEIMRQPEVYLTIGQGFFTEDGDIANADTKEFLAGWAKAFAAFIESHK